MNIDILNQNENIKELMLAAQMNVVTSFSVYNISGDLILQCEDAKLNYINSKILITSDYPVSLDSDMKYVVEFDYFNNGIKHRCASNIYGISNLSDSLTIETTGPYTLDRFQRRQFERYNIPEDIDAYITLDENCEYLTYLKVIDISVGGLSCFLKTNHELYVSKIFPEAVVEINGKSSSFFVTPVELRHFKYKESLEGYICGFKFVDLNPNASLSIFNLIGEIKKH